MHESKDYIKDITEIRSMMERSSKFMSLSGLSGVIAGICALIGAFVAYSVFGFSPDGLISDYVPNLEKVIFLAMIVLVIAIGTAAILSNRKAVRRKEKIWDPVARRLLINMLVPLGAGGIMILILIAKGLIGFIAPFTLLFYGMALYNASKFTYVELRSLGLVEIGLGLLAAYFIEYGLLIWALGFGVLHIIYGIYMHYKYER